jgi:hypothetical protein
VGVVVCGGSGGGGGGGGSKSSGNGVSSGNVRPWKDDRLQTLLWSVSILMEQRYGPKRKWEPVDHQFRVWRLDVAWRDARDLKNKHNTWRAANKDLPRSALDNDSLKSLVE